jgi:hypothetical protein
MIGNGEIQSHGRERWDGDGSETLTIDRNCRSKNFRLNGSFLIPSNSDSFGPEDMIQKITRIGQRSDGDMSRCSRAVIQISMPDLAMERRGDRNNFRGYQGMNSSCEMVSQPVQNRR